MHWCYNALPASPSKATEPYPIKVAAKEGSRMAKERRRPFEEESRQGADVLEIGAMRKIEKQSADVVFADT